MVVELLKAALFGIVEGVTEWLPISSTGHLILLDEFITLNMSDEFKSMFDVVIQLGAILAVIVLFFHKLNPFAPSKSGEEKKQTWGLWFKVVAAIIPSGIVGVLFDDWMDAHLHNGIVVSIALIVYGTAFILVERRREGKYLNKAAVSDVYDITYKTALIIGLFQCLSLIPGTSRSGSTILGAILIGVGRSAGAEFSFFMAIPTMLGASAIKGLKFLLSGVSATGTEIDCRLRGVLCGESSGHPGADAVCAQSFLLRLRRVPHRAGHYCIGVFRFVCVRRQGRHPMRYEPGWRTRHHWARSVSSHLHNRAEHHCLVSLSKQNQIN